MLINIQHAETTLENVTVSKLQKPSTLKQRVVADRIVIALLYACVIAAATFFT